MERSRLPAQLEVESALAARSFQIKAMLSAMRNARASQTTRAWQLLPRYMRRRAASHNLLRLPKPFRAKALREMASSKTEAKTRSDLRKRDPNRTIKVAENRRRQLRQRAARPEARWLETHLWHSKRFRMTRSPDDKLIQKDRLNYPAAAKKLSAKGLGKRPSHPPTSVGKDTKLVASEPSSGFLLAETPFMKQYRASWRSAKEKVILHDASYDAWFVLSCDCAERFDRKGKSKEREDDEADSLARKVLARMLKRTGLAEGWGDEYSDGAMECSTVLLGKPGGRVIRTKSTTEQTASSSSSGASETLMSHARLLAPVRLLWLWSTDGRKVMLRSAPGAASNLSRALSEAVEEENLMQKDKSRTRDAMEIDGKSMRIVCEVHRLPSAPAPDAVVPVGRKTRRQLLRKKLRTANVISKQNIVRNGFGQPLKFSQSQKEHIAATLKARIRSLWRQDRLKGSKKQRTYNAMLLKHFEAWLRALTESTKAGAAKVKGWSRQVARQLDKLPKASVELEGFNTFELVGPDSGRLLAGVLRLVHSTSEEKRKAFGTLTQQLLPQHSPEGLVLSVNVHDPRLR